MTNDAFGKLLINDMILSNPYPGDVFGEIKKRDWDRLDVFCRESLGYPPDRVSGDLMRRGYKAAVQKMTELINDYLAEDSGGHETAD